MSTVAVTTGLENSLIKTTSPKNNHHSQQKNILLVLLNPNNQTIRVWLHSNLMIMNNVTIEIVPAAV